MVRLCILLYCEAYEIFSSHQIPYVPSLLLHCFIKGVFPFDQLLTVFLPIITLLLDIFFGGIRLLGKALMTIRLGFEDFILEDLPNGWPVVRIVLEHFQNQPLHLLVAIRELQVLGDIGDAWNLGVVQIGEGSLFGHHEIEQTAEGPNVYLFSLFFLSEHLMGIVL